MNATETIRILAKGNNERGDLFTRLTKDLFFALGYDDLRLNVHKSGREIDLLGPHRFEPRWVVGECKAQADKIGGLDLNKFLGVLTRERMKRSPTPVAGYFISLSGFTETGKDQEFETGDDRVILIDGPRIVSELQTCRVIVEKRVAIEQAGRCSHHCATNSMLDHVQLLGHSRGYVWAIFYSINKEVRQFALVHADGTLLAKNLASEVIKADRDCRGILYKLEYLAPPPAPADRQDLAAAALRRYQDWIGSECGFIHLDGLPADSDLSATRLKLERLFVPLKAIVLEPDSAAGGSADQGEREPQIVRIGRLLERASRLALLASPGGGKSTLMKRLAIAYSFPSRRDEVIDELPDRDWLPLLLRCRELRERAHLPFIELINGVAKHSGMREDEQLAFQDLVHNRLRGGSVLLLIDGLDEISDEGARRAFADHLRTFVAVFPGIALVVTSREAGFRLVAGVVAGVCERAKLAPLDKEDALSLCVRWHVEVVADSDKVRSDAAALAESIWTNEKIRTLAENPLLLTTLLVVKRWIRELPRSRTALYREAIRVLVRTWNIEGYAPLDEDETLVQLSYVATSMMEKGDQQIGEKALLKLLKDSRRELEPELQFVQQSASEFLTRIEYRSSLLMQTGHQLVDGELQPVYEFRHLTFQEYLAARGYVEEQYPGRDTGKALADLLEPHFYDETWAEVIPLAAVLAGRKADDLVRRMTNSREPGSQPQASPVKRRGRTLYSADPKLYLLFQSIRDEVQVSMQTLTDALREIASRCGDVRSLDQDIIPTVLVGKFGGAFQEIIEKAYFAGGPGVAQFLGAMERVATFRFFGDKPPVLSTTDADSLLSFLTAGNREQRVYAALACMQAAYSTKYRRGQRPREEPDTRNCDALGDALSKMVRSRDVSEAIPASWALAWFGDNRLTSKPPTPETILDLSRLWTAVEPDERCGHFVAWALSAQRLLPRDSIPPDLWGQRDEDLLQFVASYRVSDQSSGSNSRLLGSFVVGWYRRSPWNDEDLVKILPEDDTHHHWLERSPTAIDVLTTLGQPGRDLIEKVGKKQPNIDSIATPPN